MADPMTFQYAKIVATNPFAFSSETIAHALLVYRRTQSSKPVKKPLPDEKPAVDEFSALIADMMATLAIRHNYEEIMVQ